MYMFNISNNKLPDHKYHFNDKKAAEMLAINAQTLRKWDASDQLKTKRETGKVGRFMYEENDLEDFLSNDFHVLKK